MKNIIKKAVFIIPALILIFLIFPSALKAEVTIYQPSYYDRQEISTECGTYDFATQTGSRELFCQNDLCGTGSSVIGCACATHTCCAEYKNVKVEHKFWFDSYKNVLSNITCVKKQGLTPQTTEEVETGTKIPIKLQVPLPGFDEVEITGTTFGNYLSTFYRYFSGIVGILAAAMIVYAGIQWIVAAGNKTAIEKAKATMSGALIGLVLTLAAYLILYTVNPSLVKWRSLDLSIIEKKELAEEYALECDTDTGLVELKDYFSPRKKLVIIDKNVSDPRVQSSVITMLGKAAAKLKNEGLTLVIKSAHRNIKMQERLYNCYKNFLNTGECHQVNCPDGCNVAAEPSCDSPHVTGYAVDACVYSGDEKELCNMLLPKYNGDKPNIQPPYKDYQLVLQQKMAEAGFSRYCGEWWHFEGMPISDACAPGEYK